MSIPNPLIKMTTALPKILAESSDRDLSLRKTKNKNHSNKESLRILVLNWRCLRHPQAGGSEINVFEQSSHWTTSGHKVSIFTADPGREYAPDKIEDFVGVQILRFGGQYTVYLLAALYVLFFSWKYDVILDVSNGIPFFTPLFTRRPVTLMIHHVHNQQWFREFSVLPARIGWFLEKHVVPFLYRNKNVITVSPTSEEELLHIGFKKSQISIVFSGLSITVPENVTKPETHRIAYVGRLKAYKRLHLLVEAVNKLRYEFPRVHLDIAGNGDTLEELRELVKKLDLQAHVTLYGFVTEATKLEILARANVFATPSMQEGWGLSVIEANAYGCPAVAYNVPGLSASIPNNETGFLANTDAEFVEAIAKIFRDEKLSERLSRGAKFWAGMFDWKSSSLSTLSVMTIGS